MATGIPRAGKNRFGKVELNYDGKVSTEEVLAGPKAELKSVWDSYGEKGDNLLIWGDNLAVMRSLLEDPTIAGKIKLIYIDPPYSTQSVFQTLDQTDAYSDELSGAEYVEFMRERLIVMRELLSDDGSIYVHLDSNMVFEIKIVMDEVFGKNNFRNMITRKKCSTKNTTRKQYGNISDYILFYSKSNKYVWNRPYDPWEEERLIEEYPYIDEATGRRYKRVPVHAPGTRKGETGMPWRGKLPPAGKHWQVTPARLDELDSAGEIYWSSNGNPRRKVWASDSLGIPRQDIWLQFRDSRNQNVKGTGYPTEKNFEMMQEIIMASSNKGDIVLDCFCGSGTTLHAADTLGRRWIGIDVTSEAISCSVKRFTTGAETMGDYVETNKARMSRDHLRLQLTIPSSSISLLATQNHVSEAIELFGLDE